MSTNFGDFQLGVYAEAFRTTELRSVGDGLQVGRHHRGDREARLVRGVIVAGLPPWGDIRLTLWVPNWSSTAVNCGIAG
jgi:hypothetical protein